MHIITNNIKKPTMLFHYEKLSSLDEKKRFLILSKYLRPAINFITYFIEEKVYAYIHQQFVMLNINLNIS